MLKSKALYVADFAGTKAFHVCKQQLSFSLSLKLSLSA